MQSSTRERPSHEPAHHLAAVIAVQQEIATADLDLANIMSLITRRAMELTSASGAAVEMLEGDEMVYRSVAGFAEPFVGLRLRAEASISGLCVRVRKALRVEDSETDERVDRVACRRIGVRSLIVLPLLFRDRAVGVLKVMSAEAGWFVDEDTSTLQLMAGLISAALAHAQAFEAKARAEQRRTDELESLLANAPLGIAFFDREHRYVRINRMLADLNLRSPEEHLGRTILEVLGTYGAPFDEKVGRVFETQEGVQWEVSARFGSEDERHWLCAFFPMFVGGQLALVGAYLIEITARKRSEHALQTTLGLLDAVMEASPDGIYVKDRESRMLYANRATLEVLGKPASEVLGRGVADYLAGDPTVIIENDRRVMERALSETLEETVSLPGKPPRVFLSSKSPYRAPNGEVIGTIGISKEITERKESERRLRSVLHDLERHRAQLEAVFQAVQDGIVVFDREGRVMLINESEARITGYASASEMVRDLAYFGTVFELREIGDGVIPLDEWPAARVLRGESIKEWQLHGRRTDIGREWYFSFSGEPVRDEQGEIAMAVMITRDITDYKRAELGLREAVRARDEFVSVASHELKTPLTSLQLQIEGLRRALARGPDPASEERVRKFSLQTSRQTARLGQLVDDMLDLSRIATGKFAIEPGPMDLATTVQEVVDRLRPQLEAANGEVNVHLESVRGEWDRQRLEQVVSNLLTNAMRYGKGSPIAVELRRRPQSALLTVRDRGIGIAPDDLARIFERFERAISASEVSGLGLGLFISRQIVEAHHGRIWAESELGQGATFYVELPVKG